MVSRPLLRLLLALSCLGLAAFRIASRAGPMPVLLLEDSLPTPPPSAALAGVEPDFAQYMTPDDVARGLWALARGSGPGLDPTQAAALLPEARRARTARAEVDRLRGQRRGARDAWRDDGLALAVALLDQGWTPHAETK